MTAALVGFLQARLSGDCSEINAEYLRESDSASCMFWNKKIKVVTARRIVAEIEARQRFVEDLGTVIDEDCDPEELRLAWRSLRLLAKAYADHPDYCEEWKP